MIDFCKKLIASNCSETEKNKPIQWGFILRKLVHFFRKIDLFYIYIVLSVFLSLYSKNCMRCVSFVKDKVDYNVCFPNRYKQRQTYVPLFGLFLFISSSITMLQVFGRVCAVLTPVNFGKKYLIPTRPYLWMSVKKFPSWQKIAR